MLLISFDINWKARNMQYIQQIYGSSLAIWFLNVFGTEIGEDWWYLTNVSKGNEFCFRPGTFLCAYRLTDQNSMELDTFMIFHPRYPLVIEHSYGKSPCY